MSIKQYFKKFHSKLEKAEGKKPSIVSILKHAIEGVYDYFKYGSTITDYFELTFYNKTAKEKAEYVTWRFHKRFIYQADDANLIDKLAGKAAMYKETKEYVNRKQLDTKLCSYEEFEKYIKDVPKFFYKPNNESCGNGIQLIDVACMDAREVYDIITREPGILDEVIIQHHTMKELNTSSVNTVRVFTFRTNNNIYFTGAALRMGTTGFIDNYSAGGVVASVDVKTGKTKPFAEDMHGRIYAKHPVSGVIFDGFKVPNWDTATDFLMKIAKEYPLNYVAWDLAVLEEGFTLVEANPAGMINVIQIAGADGKMKLYKKLDEEWKKHPYVESKESNRYFNKVLC